MVTAHQDFPKPGITFRDFAPILKSPEALSYITDEFSRLFDLDRIDAFAGIESRGFILGAAMAVKHGKGFAMIRKVGKTPGGTVRLSYDLEYGSDSIEMRKDALDKNQRVLICDDLLATGGTARAAAELVEMAGATVSGIAFIIELTELNGKEKLDGYNAQSLVKY